MPCIVVDISPDKEKALNIALNAPFGEFDEPQLSVLLAELAEIPDIDLSLTGFDQAELAKLLTSASSDRLTYIEKELVPYKRTHVLLSFPPGRLLDLQPHLAKILEIPEVEYAQSSN